MIPTHDSSHESHYTANWHPTLHGQYYWHCLTCDSFFLQYGCDPQEKWLYKSPVYKGQLDRACRSCEKGKDIGLPKFNPNMECCKRFTK